MGIDLLLKNAAVYDGLGAPARVADVGVVGESIAFVRPDCDVEAEIAIDCSGLAVAPGFINVLSHGYRALLSEPSGMSDLAQGVTTLLFGEKMPYAPLREDRRATLSRAFERDGVDLDVDWRNVAGFLQAVARRGTAQNVCSLVSASAVMDAVVPDATSAPTAEQVAEMRQLVEAEVDAGALGLGTALVYPPEAWLPPDAVVELARGAAASGGAYFSHMRGEGAGLLDAVGEVISISETAQLPAEIWHFKAMGRANWPLMERAIDLVEQARARDVRIGADMYPYAASSTGLWNLIPVRYRAGASTAWLAALAEPDTRVEVTSQMRGRIPEPDNIVLLRFQRPEHHGFQGRTLSSVADELGLEPGEAVVELVLADRSAIPSAYFAISEDNIRLVAAQPWVGVGSDGSAITDAPPDAAPVHPRAYGAFARFLGRLARDERVISVEEAIRRMTSLPAATLGLARRGVVAPGNQADIVVFDESRVIDNATFEHPHQLATGVHHVVVNGALAFAHGRPTGTLAGQALLRGS